MSAPLVSLMAAADIGWLAAQAIRPASSVDEPAPELSVYRSRTVALLRRYCRCSVELGRVPSIVGREFFRSRVSSYQVHTFEDRVIFAYDVERCLGLLDHFSRELIARIAMQEYSYDEAARLLHCGRATIGRRFPLALDRLSEILLERRLLKPFGAETCQEPGHKQSGASDTPGDA